MTPTEASPLDLTTVANVHSYAGVTSISDDGTIQLAISALSLEFPRATGGSNSDGSVPSISPFVQPVAYNEFYDGSGTQRQFVRNWPVQSVQLVQIGFQAIPPSPSFGNFGYVIDSNGKSIVLQNAGNGSQYARLATRYLGARWVFNTGFQNVNIQYTAGFNGVPIDIVRGLTQWAAIAYKRKDWIDQASLAMSTGGAGSATTRYRDWDYPKEICRLIRNYERSAIV